MFTTPTRRHLLQASPGLFIPGLAAAAAPRATLTLGGQGGLFQDLFEQLGGTFTANAANPDLFYYGVQSSSQLLAALRRQRDETRVDVALLDLADARRATEEGLVEPLTAQTMPVLNDLSPSAIFPGIAGPAAFTEPLVLLYDAAQTQAPSAWRSLWTGAEDRSIGIPAPPDPIGLAFAVIAGRLFGGGGEADRLINGINAIAGLSRRVQTWDPRPDVYHLVADGNARYGIGWNMPAQVFSDRYDGRLGVAFPEEGTISRVTTVNLVKGSRLAGPARQFISWLLGPEAQRSLVEKMHLGPVNAKARFTRASLDRTANTPARTASAIPVDWAVLDSVRDDLTRRWREVVPGNG